MYLCAMASVTLARQLSQHGSYLMHARWPLADFEDHGSADFSAVFLVGGARLDITAKRPVAIAG